MPQPPKRDAAVWYLQHAPEADPHALTALAGPFVRALRQHPLRGQLAAWGTLSAIPWSAQGYFCPEASDPGLQLDYHTGVAYPQDAASQLPVALLAPQPGEVVLDACAAPGSKTTQIGLALGDHGLVIAADASEGRRRALAENLQRQGLCCGLVTPLPLPVLVRHIANCCDAVLVDAPCSGHALVSPRERSQRARTQAKILSQAALALRPGGRMVYSTCTPWPEENEEQVAAFLASHPDFVVETQPAPGVDADLAGYGGCRLWPHRQQTEPFFAIRLRKQGVAPRMPLPGEARLSSCAVPHEALEHLVSRQHGEALWVASAQAAACGIPSECRGLALGYGSVEDFRWDHWGAQAAMSRGVPAQTVSNEMALRLFAGEECDVPPGLLCNERGNPLGWSSGRRLRLNSRQVRMGLKG